MKDQEKNAAPRVNVRKTRRFIQKQKFWMNHGRVKSLGFLEKALLRRAGRKDGERGLPAAVDDNIWSSPFLEGEVKGYQKFSARMWGQLQLATQGTKARICQLMNSNTKELLLSRRAELAAAEEAARDGRDQRKQGEEHLTPAQVRHRRERELAQHLLPLINQILGLEKKLAQEEEELLQLRSVISELEHTTRLICDHLLLCQTQRIAVYWDAALKAQQGYAALPLLPDIVFDQTAEARYRNEDYRMLRAEEVL